MKLEVACQTKANGPTTQGRALSEVALHLQSTVNQVSEGHCPVMSSHSPPPNPDHLAQGGGAPSTTAPLQQPLKCPTVRFGRTDLQMPIITCGGMRMQQTWQPPEGFSLKDVTPECQENFEAIVDRAMSLGINHFETARGYGCSEIQYGKALKRHNRKDMIIQTKVKPFADVEEFKKTLETSFDNLDPEYLDLIAFHGVNLPKQLDWILNHGLFDVVRQYQKEGKIRFVGFSTHGPTPLILQAIETGLFDYVNLHYQFIGSYFSEGTGTTTSGNLEAVIAAAKKHDMGVFIISPTDKGGMLYKPSAKFADACKPFSPIAFHNCWLWSHTDPPIHTLVVGAARPSDFDEHMAAAQQFVRIKEDLKSKRVTSDPIKDVEAHLLGMQREALGEGWRQGWWKGLPTCYETSTGIHVVFIVWLWSLVKAFGLHEYAKAQYQKLEANRAAWEKELSVKENVDKIFDWCPGLDMSWEAADVERVNQDLSKRPDAPRIMEILKEAHEWLAAPNQERLDKAFMQREGWLTAFDLQPDVPFPERGGGGPS